MLLSIIVLYIPPYAICYFLYISIVFPSRSFQLCASFHVGFFTCLLIHLVVFIYSLLHYHHTEDDSIMIRSVPVTPFKSFSLSSFLFYD